MKACTAILFTLLAAPLAFAQGPITPPVGPPAAGMKTLDQIEARTPVNATTCPADANYTHVISTPGSYYLTGNIAAAAAKGGIRISSERVTLDLNGFSITGVGGATGLQIDTAAVTVTVRNGALKTWTAYGVNGNAPGTTLQGIAVSEVPTGDGIRLNSSSALVDGCTVRKAQQGIIASSETSICQRCRVEDLDAADEIYGIWGGVVNDCTVADMVSTAAPSNGITAAILGTSVSRCSVDGPFSAVGDAAFIRGGTVTECHIACFDTPAASAKSYYGIMGNAVSHCSIIRLIGNTSSTVAGIYASRVSDCEIESISNSGSGTLVRGIEAANGSISATRSNFSTAALVTDCMVSGVQGEGISSNNFATVTGCRVSYCGVAGISIGNGAARNNTTNNCAIGVKIVSSGLATGNCSQGDTTAFSFGASVRSGPVVTGGGTGTFDPNANIDL